MLFETFRLHSSLPTRHQLRMQIVFIFVCGEHFHSERPITGSIELYNIILEQWSGTSSEPVVITGIISNVNVAEWLSSTTVYITKTLCYTVVQLSVDLSGRRAD